MRYIITFFANNCTILILICCIYYPYGVPFSTRPIITAKKIRKLRIQFCGFYITMQVVFKTATSSNSASTWNHWSRMPSSFTSISGVAYLLIHWMAAVNDIISFCHPMMERYFAYGKSP